MIQHVYERVRRCPAVDRVVVATDDERIRKVVEAFGGEVEMTGSQHASGTERVAEVAARVLAAIYVNVQGDEPLISPEAISAAVEAVLADESVQVATLCVPLREPADVADPNVVKVVCDARGDALYFSRAPIPALRDARSAAGESSAGAVHRKHLGLYVFRRDILLRFSKLSPGRLEKLEQLEQLRLLENGIRIRVVETSFDSLSVDVPEDVPRVERMLSRQ